MYHQFFIVSTYLSLLQFVALVGSATLITLLPFISRPFDASKLKVCCQHVSCQPYPYHGYSFVVIFCSAEFINGLSISIPSVTTYHFQQLVIITFFLYVVPQNILLIGSLFEVCVCMLLIQLLFMFMSPWKVSEPLYHFYHV